MEKLENCNHNDFWFSRTLDYCIVHDELEMQNYCKDCGVSAHLIDLEKEKK